MNRYKMHTEATPDTAKKITCSIGSPTAVNGTETSVHCQVINSTCVSALKQKGNELLKESKPKAAIKTYTSALEAAAVEHTDDQERAVLLSNRAFAHITCRQYIQVGLSSVRHVGRMREVSALRHVWALRFIHYEARNEGLNM